MAYHFIFQFQFGAVGETEGIEIAKTDQHLAKLIKLFPNGVLIRFNQGNGIVHISKLMSLYSNFIFLFYLTSIT